MADDLELTPAEAEYFQSGGDASAYIDEQDDIADEQSEQQQDTSPRADFGGRTIHVENGRLPSESEQRLREELHQERLARQQDQLAHARTGERLNMLSEVTAPPQQLPDAVQVPAHIDAEKDIFGAIAQIQDRFAREDQSRADFQQNAGFVRACADVGRTFMQAEPDCSDLPQAEQYLLGKELMGLMSRAYPGASVEQIEQAIGAQQVPPEILNELYSNYGGLLQQLAQSGFDQATIAGHVYQRAELAGYQSQRSAKAAERQAAADRKNAARKQHQAEQREDEEFRIPMRRRIEAMGGDAYQRWLADPRRYQQRRRWWHGPDGMSADQLERSMFFD